MAAAAIPAYTRSTGRHNSKAWPRMVAMTVRSPRQQAEQAYR